MPECRLPRPARPLAPRHRVASKLGAVGALAAAPVLAATVFIATTTADAAHAPVGLGTADSFAVLAGSGITNTGPTTINGDVGTSPTPSMTGFATVTLTGTNHAGDAVTQGAKVDLVTAYDDAAGRGPASNVPVELGGTTKLAGVYTSPTLGLTGTLTLDGQGNPDSEFVFQAGSTLITASNSRVLFVNGADPCHVVWQVGSSATFGTGTDFVGNVLAQTSITANTGATFLGRLLARDGAVTLDTNTITKTSCATSPSTTTTTAGGSTTTSTTVDGGGTTSTTLAGTPTTAPSNPAGGTGTPGGRSGGSGGSGGSGPATPDTSTSTPRLPATGAETRVLTGVGLSLVTLGAVLLGTRRRLISRAH